MTSFEGHRERERERDGIFTVPVAWAGPGELSVSPLGGKNSTKLKVESQDSGTPGVWVPVCPLLYFSRSH